MNGCSSNPVPTLDDVRAEKARRRNGPANPLSFREFVTLVKPRYRWFRHCEILADVLQRVADGELRRVMVFMPPRHGKSELVSRLFTAYWLYRYPHQWVGVCSYAAELAYTLSRAARENFQNQGGQLKDDAAAVKHWETRAGGGLWAAGVGGPITGKGWHLGIIDDPVKNAQDAASPAIRETQREWYGSTFYTREEPDDNDRPDGALVVVQTRWNEEDLAGWLLAQERDQEEGEEESERWHIVSMEAIKEPEPFPIPPTCTLEPDWREPGAALCPERRPADKLRKIAKRIGSYFFSALFQQRPTPREGEMFKVDQLGVVKALPVGCTFIRYWDKAGTAGGGAYTAGVLLAKPPEGRFIVVHVRRGQWSAAERERHILQTTQSDEERFGAVTTWIEQEPGSSGKESAENTVAKLAGFAAFAETVTGDKEVRATPFAAQVEVGNVALYDDGTWSLSEYREELRQFPKGRYKDQVDASSGAFNKLAVERELWAL